jgi:ligand-binding sensor domain-containing protein
LLLAGCISAAFGQQYHVQNWHVEDGLPDGEITAIQQTPDGYLWVGTPKGLARFDGNRFKIFKANPASTQKDWRITCLLASRDGTLWISTEDGNLVRKQNGKFDNIQSPMVSTLGQEESHAPGGNWLWKRRMNMLEDTAGRQGEEILDSRNHLVEDGEGAIWWHVSDSVVMRLKAGEWTVFTPTNGLPATRVRQLMCDHEGHIWVEAGGKLHRYDGNGWDLTQSAITMSGLWPVLAPANEGGRYSFDHRGGRRRRAHDRPNRPARYRGLSQTRAH